LIVEDDESDVTNTEVDSSDVNAGNADRPSSKNTVQTLDPAYGLSKPIDPPSPRRLDDIDDEVLSTEYRKTFVVFALRKPLRIVLVDLEVLHLR
jgi:hypothetical protein